MLVQETVVMKLSGIYGLLEQRNDSTLVYLETVLRCGSLHIDSKQDPLRLNPTQTKL
jgi:hypothetical protein